LRNDLWSDVRKGEGKTIERVGHDEKNESEKVCG
jgi:hypothetical protein